MLMYIDIVVYGCDHIWVTELDRKLMRTRGKVWYEINADVERNIIKEWFPNAMIFDYGSPNLSGYYKRCIADVIELTKELAETIFIKGIKRKNSFMSLFKNQGENDERSVATDAK